LQPILVLAQQVSKPSKTEADKLLQQGEVQIKRSDRDQWQAALQSYQQALSIYQSLQDRRGEGQALGGIGNAYRSLRAYAEAERYLQKALVIAKDIDDPELESKALIHLGSVYRFWGPDSFDKGVDYYQQGLSIAQSIRNPQLEMRALRLLGMALLLRDGPSKGLPLMQQAVTKARQVGLLETAETLNNLGGAYYLSKQLNSAINAHQEALAIAEQIGDRPAIGAALQDIATVYQYKGQYANQLKFALKALAVLRRDPHSKEEVVDLLSDTTTAYQVLGRYQDMLKSGQQFLEAALVVKENRNIMEALLDLCTVSSMLGRFEDQETFAERGLAYARKVGNQYYQREFLSNLQVAYAQLGQFEEIREVQPQLDALPPLGELSVKDMEEIAEHAGFPREPKLPGPVNEANALLIKGQGYEAQKQYTQAEQAYKNALSVAQASDDYSNQLSGLFWLAGLYRGQQMYPQAIDTYQQLIARAQEFGYLNDQSAGWAMLGVLHYQQKQYAEAIEPFRQAIAIQKNEQLRQALPLSLGMLGDSYFQLERLPEATATLREAVKLNESMRAGLRDLNKVSLMDSHAFVYQQLQRSLIAQNQINPALEIAERGRARAFAELLASRIQGVPKLNPPNVSQIQQIAKAQNATLVEYSLIRHEYPRAKPFNDLFIWVIKPTGDITFRQVDLKPLQQQNQTLANLVESVQTRMVRESNSSNDEQEPKPAQVSRTLNPSLRQLHQLLIQPIADLLPTDPSQQVIFLPQRDLFNIPFPALQDAKGTYLVEQHTIRTAPSIQVLALTRQQRQRIQGKGEGAVVAGLPRQALIIGNPVPMPEDWQPLKGAEQEAQDVAKLLRSQAIIGEPATETAIVKQMPNARLIHLATHGIANDENPLEESYVVLAPSKTDDGKLTAGEVLDKLKLNAELVVLSACQTGKGKVTGDGVVGLSRAFIAAGTPSIVVSLWDVNDESTALLMTEFYQNLERSPDRAQALRQAMLKALAQYLEPGKWAAFTLIGEAQ
jgi:CHAT domain-containing protein